VRELSSFDKSEILLRISEGIQAKRESLAGLVTEEVGKSIQFSRVEVDRAVTTFRLASEEAKRIGGEVLPLDLLPASSGRFGFVRRFPVGLVLAICPFNYPINLAAHKIGPAIAAGNAVLFKPAPQAPGSAMELTKIIEAIGLRREDVYIANVIKCRPPANRNPEPDEVATCEPFLFQQIAAIQPKLPGGELAEQLVLGDRLFAAPHVALHVGVLDAQDEGPPVSAREEPVEHGGADVAEVEASRGARGEACPNGHLIFRGT